MRVEVAAAAGDAERLLAECCAALGRGCHEEADGDRVRLRFWAAPVEAPDARARLEAAVAAAGLSAEVTAAPETSAWQDATRAFHRPVEIAGGALRVRPPWEPATPGVPEIVIDPGMAFGTAQHATTRGCLELIATLPPDSLADVGCGSGILALAALRLGFGPVWALDSDPLAVEAAAENARRNGLPLEPRLARAEDALPEAGTVVANIQLDVLVRLAARLAERPPPRVILSGLRDEDGAEALAVYAALGYRERARVADSGWLSLRLERP